MRAFWQFSGYTDRLLTAEGIDHLHLSVAAQSPEGAQSALEGMQERAPNPIKFTAHAIVAATSVRDEEGVQALRSMF